MLPACSLSSYYGGAITKYNPWKSWKDDEIKKKQVERKDIALASRTENQKGNFQKENKLM